MCTYITTVCAEFSEYNILLFLREVHGAGASETKKYQNNFLCCSKL